VARCFERAVLGTVMNMIAFTIERRVLKAIRGTAREPPRPAGEGELASGRNGRDG
jgi:hypothetical protein